MSRFIFVTGGVVSSLGKGILTSSLAAVLEARDLKVNVLAICSLLGMPQETAPQLVATNRVLLVRPERNSRTMST